MDNVNDARIIALILFSLARKRKWGESHTAIENLFKAFKSEALGKEGIKRAKELADDLARAGFIFKKPTNYGVQVSLNPKKAKEIKKSIKEELKLDI